MPPAAGGRRRAGRWAPAPGSGCCSASASPAAANGLAASSVMRPRRLLVPSLYQMSPLGSSAMPSGCTHTHGKCRSASGRRPSEHAERADRVGVLLGEEEVGVALAVVADLHLQRQARQRRGAGDRRRPAGGRSRRCSRDESNTVMPSNEPGVATFGSMRAIALAGRERDPDDAVRVDGDVAGPEDRERRRRVAVSVGRGAAGEREVLRVAGADRRRVRAQAHDLVAVGERHPHVARLVERLVERLDRPEAELEALPPRAAVERDRRAGLVAAASGRRSRARTRPRPASRSRSAAPSCSPAGGPSSGRRS